MITKTLINRKRQVIHRPLRQTEWNEKQKRKTVETSFFFKLHKLDKQNNCYVCHMVVFLSYRGMTSEMNFTHCENRKLIIVLLMQI